MAGLESPLTGVWAYPFAKFFHQPVNCEGKYTSSFFVALRFAHTAKRVDIGPLVEDFMQIVNSFEGRSATMDLTMRIVAKKYLPSFVFSADEVMPKIEVENDATTHVDGAGDAANVSKGNPGKQVGVNETMKSSEDKAASEPVTNEDGQVDTPLPLSGKKKPLDSTVSPSDNISPLKRTRIV